MVYGLVCRKFVQEEGERLVGDDLGHLMLADYMARWGYSAPVVFDYALEALYSFGPKGKPTLSLIMREHTMGGGGLLPFVFTAG